MESECKGTPFPRTDKMFSYFFFQKEADFSRLFDKGQGKRATERGKTCGKTAGHSKGAEGVREGVRRGAGYYIQINVRVRMCDEFISYML